VANTNGMTGTNDMTRKNHTSLKCYKATMAPSSMVVANWKQAAAKTKQPTTKK